MLWALTAATVVAASTLLIPLRVVDLQEWKPRAASSSVGARLREALNDVRGLAPTWPVRQATGGAGRPDHRAGCADRPGSRAVAGCTGHPGGGALRVCLWSSVYSQSQSACLGGRARTPRQKLGLEQRCHVRRHDGWLLGSLGWLRPSQLGARREHCAGSRMACRRRHLGSRCRGCVSQRQPSWQSRIAELPVAQTIRCFFSYRSITSMTLLNSSQHPMHKISRLIWSIDQQMELHIASCGATSSGAKAR